MKRVFLLIAVLISSVYAQSNKIMLSGNLQIDSRSIFKQDKNNSLPSIRLLSEENGKKSPFLAGVLSAVLPGSGEFYTGSYLKSGIFLSIEAAVITTAIIYNKKGDDKTNEFQNYADQNWSVVRYAQWLITYKSAPPDIIKTNVDPNLPPWERVDWSKLNASETGSHKLPYHGEQQYYELIGKYHQYSPGWDDFAGGSDETDISSNLLYYSGQRGKANDFYNLASTAVIGIYINHILSALDAVWSAVRFNKDLALNARVVQFNFTDRSLLVPTIKMRYNF